MAVVVVSTRKHWPDDVWTLADRIVDLSPSILATSTSTRTRNRNRGSSCSSAIIKVDLARWTCIILERGKWTCTVGRIGTIGEKRDLGTSIVYPNTQILHIHQVLPSCKCHNFISIILQFLFQYYYCTPFRFCSAWSTQVKLDSYDDAMGFISSILLLLSLSQSTTIFQSHNLSRHCGLE